MKAATVAFLASPFVISGFTPVWAESSYQGISCDYVRSLTRAEQDYWTKRLNITSEQRHRIYVTCYKNNPPKDNNSVAKLGK